MQNISKKTNNEYRKCNLCERRCGADRTSCKIGYCRSGCEMKITRAALHYWEEPPISGNVSYADTEAEGISEEKKTGSGTVFFSGCSLGCIFCQNKEISRASVGRTVTPSELAAEMLRLEDEGALNINFVTPTHFALGVADAIREARALGLRIPTVYNTGSYDSEEALDALAGLIDIYLPDFKFYTEKCAGELANAPNYPKIAKRNIDRMVKAVGEAKISDGIMLSGVIVRILLLPSRVAEAKLALSYLYKTYGDKIYISLMNQYTPMDGMKPPLDRRVTREEYRDLVRHAEKLGVKNAFIQSEGTVGESFIPKFNLI